MLGTPKVPFKTRLLTISWVWGVGEMGVGEAVSPGEKNVKNPFY